MTPRGEVRDFFLAVINGPAEGEGCVLWPYGTTEGYGTISIDGKTCKVPVLVCAAFHGPKPPEQEARHLCGKASCVAPWHLVWGTHVENMEDRARHGTTAHNRGEKNGRSVLARHQVDEIRAAAAAGESQSSIARRYQVTPQTIHNIVKGKQWGFELKATELD